MTPELPQFLATIIAVIGVGITLAALIVTLLNQQERRTNQRIDRLEERVDRGFEQLRAETNQQHEQLRAETNQQYEQLRVERDRQYEQLRAEMNRLYEQLRAEMNQGFAQQDVRIRNLEQGQAYMSGQFSELKDYFVHRPSSGTSPETGD